MPQQENTAQFTNAPAPKMPIAVKKAVSTLTPRQVTLFKLVDCADPLHNYNPTKAQALECVAAVKETLKNGWGTDFAQIWLAMRGQPLVNPGGFNISPDGSPSTPANTDNAKTLFNGIASTVLQNQDQKLPIYHCVNKDFCDTTPMTANEYLAAGGTKKDLEPSMKISRGIELNRGSLAIAGALHAYFNPEPYVKDDNNNVVGIPAKAAEIRARYKSKQEADSTIDNRMAACFAKVMGTIGQCWGTGAQTSILLQNDTGAHYTGPDTTANRANAFNPANTLSRR